MRVNQHNRVDTFFDKVDGMPDKLEGEAIQYTGQKEVNVME